MQVIFTKDVPKVARRGDVKNVSDGHAENYLFPRGLAEKATPAKIAAHEAQKAQSQEAAAAGVAALVGRIKAADGVRYEMKAKADKTGHLYQKIDAAKVAALISLPESIIEMEHPLKEMGEHPIALRHEKANATAIVAIVAQ